MESRLHLLGLVLDNSSDHPESGEKQGPFTLAVPAGSECPRLHLHGRSETVSNFIRTFGVWQRPITAFLINYLKEGDVFVDVGANIGYFSVYAGLCVGDSGRVHAIEPDPDNAALLAANLELNGLSNAKVHRTAVADFTGEATLYQGEFNAGAHSLVQKDGLGPGAEVPVTTLDRLLADEPKVKLLKIDVQGAEISVLRGMKEMLSDSERRPAIIMEFSPGELRRNDALEEFFDFVARNRYSLRAFIANERSRTKPPQIRRATLRQIAKDFLFAKETAEFDLLLLTHR